jgi:hypothetical protein
MSPEPSRVPDLPEVRPARAPERYPVPPEFRPDRSTAPGHYPILKLFRGLEKTVPFSKYPGDDRWIREVADATQIFLSPGPGWMYVAPRRTPPEVRAHGFRMYESTDDVIVVSRSHFRNSPMMTVYLDLIHEFLHILQRKQGRELWPRRIPTYADRPTEVEAYSFSVAEARRLKVPDAFLRRYLLVPWMTTTDYRHLLENVGVTLPLRLR